MSPPANGWRDTSQGWKPPVVASHDRRFLDAVSRKVAHLDRGELTLYSGDYTAFRQQLAQAEEEGWRRYEKPEAGEEAAAAGPGLPEVVRRRREEETGRGGQGVRQPQGREGHEAVARRPAPHGGGRRERPYGEAVREGRGQDRVRVLEGRSLVRAEDLVVGYSKRIL